MHQPDNVTEPRNLFTYVGQHAFLAVINVGDGNFTLSDVIVIMDVVGQQTHICRYKQRKVWSTYIYLLSPGDPICVDDPACVRMLVYLCMCACWIGTQTFARVWKTCAKSPVELLQGAGMSRECQKIWCNRNQYTDNWGKTHAPCAVRNLRPSVRTPKRRWSQVYVSSLDLWEDSPTCEK